MTAENVYFYLFLVGVFFTAGNIAISGISHVIGGLGGGDAGTDGADSIDMDGHAEIGDSGGFGGVDAGMGHAADMSIDAGGHFGADTGGDLGGDFSAGSDIGGDFGVDAGGDMGGDFGGDAGGGDMSVDAGVGAEATDISDGIGGAAFSLGTKADLHIDADIAAGHGTYIHSADAHGAADAGSGTMGSHTGGSGMVHAGAKTGAHASQPNAGGFNLLSLLTTWLPIRPTALICFSTVTGGAGTIFLKLGWENPLMHICSIASGYGLSMLLGVALPRKLRRAQNTSAAERYELIGLSAQVTSTILENSFGRISYTVRDNTYSAPARHIDAKRVAQGSLVVICEIKKNVFYVTELSI